MSSRDVGHLLPRRVLQSAGPFKFRLNAARLPLTPKDSSSCSTNESPATSPTESWKSLLDGLGAAPSQRPGKTSSGLPKLDCTPSPTESRCSGGFRCPFPTWPKQTLDTSRDLLERLLMLPKEAQDPLYPRLTDNPFLLFGNFESKGTRFRLTHCSCPCMSPRQTYLLIWAV